MDFYVKFFLDTHVTFTSVKKATYERSCLNVRVAPRSTFTFTRETSYISRYFIYARKLYVGAHDKVIPKSENPPEVTAVHTEVLSINESLLFSSSVYVGLLFH